METNAEHYYDRISGLTICAIAQSVMAEDIGNEIYCTNCNNCKSCLLDTIIWLNEEYKPKLKACPFCGSTKAPRLLTEDELKDNGDPDWYTVCCSAPDGGCGATSGYAQSKDGAIKKWNRRE